MQSRKIGKKWKCSAAAAPAAKSLQSCPTLCNPIDGSPPGFPIPGILRATHSSALAWKIPWAEEPGGLKSMGSRRVGHD